MGGSTLIAGITVLTVKSLPLKRRMTMPNLSPTLLAILARFDGDRTLALNYCEDIAYKYSALRDEYRRYHNTLLDLGPNLLKSER